MAQAELYAKATEYGVKISDRLVDRGINELFGEGRATRSTDVYIINKSRYDLTLLEAPQPKENDDGSGVWTCGALPPHVVKSGEIEMYGCQSHGFMCGVTEAYVWYEANTPDKTINKIWWYTSNPFAGKCHGDVYFTNSPLDALIIVGGSNNNVVHIIITNKLD